MRLSNVRWVGGFPEDEGMTQKNAGKLVRQAYLESEEWMPEECGIDYDKSTEPGPGESLPVVGGISDELIWAWGLTKDNLFAILNDGSCHDSWMVLVYDRASGDEIGRYEWLSGGMPPGIEFKRYGTVSHRLKDHHLIVQKLVLEGC